MLRTSVKRICAFLASFSIFFVWPADALQTPADYLITVHGLRVEGAVEPLAVETDTPRFSWKLSADERARAKMQSAYRIVLGEWADPLARHTQLLWDSGKVTSSAISATYHGKSLIDLKRYYWAACVWDEKGRGPECSKPASFTMAPRRMSDWDGAQWIAGRQWISPSHTQAPPAPELRRDFSIHKQVTKARLDVSGIGYYDLLLDGSKLDDRILAPGWTSYNKRILYDSYDVTGKLARGGHTLGVTLGRGFYANAGGVIGFLIPGPWSSPDPKLKLCLHIDYADGSSESIVSDNSWTTHDGPTVANFAYQGETYDARNETPGWTKYHYVGSGWSPARVVAAPSGTLTPEILDPIRVVKTIEPDALKQIKPGVWLFSFPYVAAGWAQLHVTGPAGTRIVLKYGERLKPDGTVNNLGDPNITPGDIQTDTYILKGNPSGEIWEPRFSFKSFAYVQVEGLPGTPQFSAVRMRILHTDVASSGSFSSSNQLLNDIQTMLLRSTLSNLQSLPSDTPMYEKRGWLGDAQVMAPTAIQNFDLERLYQSRLRGIADDQAEDGNVPVLSPIMDNPPRDYADNTWSSAFITIPWDVYMSYGNDEVLHASYASMARYVDFANGQTKDGILNGLYGDWESPFAPAGSGAADVRLTETAYLYHCATIMAKVARIVGHDEDIPHWAGMAESILHNFNQTFLDRERGGYFDQGNKVYHQTANVIPLAFGMVPEDIKIRVADNLAADVKANGDHLNTGILGAKDLLPVLSQTGHADLAFAVATQTTEPSWGAMLYETGGRTGLWETWNLKDTRSMNHMMFGSVGNWFYANLAGISALTPGYGTIAIRPDYPQQLEWVKATRTVAAGVVISSWKRVGNTYTLKVSIPVNSTAEVSIPVSGHQTVTESGVPAAKSHGVTYIATENGRAVYKIGSGSYVFVTREK